MWGAKAVSGLASEWVLRKEWAGIVWGIAIWRIVGDVVGGLLIFGMSLCVVGLLIVRFLFAEPEHKGPSDIEITEFAQEAHSAVGAVPLVLPFMAMRDQISAEMLEAEGGRILQEYWWIKDDSFRVAASNPIDAPALDQIRVRVASYAFDDFATRPWKKICGQLRRNWEKSVCDDPWAPLPNAVPYGDLQFLDDRKPSNFEGQWSGGREIVADQLRAMDLQSGRASPVFDVELGKHGRNCTPGMSVARHLMAVWSVRDSKSERAEAQADREGRVIVAFVNYGLGAEEDFAALLEVVCTARRPGSDRYMIRTKPVDPCAE